MTRPFLGRFSPALSITRRAALPLIAALALAGCGSLGTNSSSTSKPVAGADIHVMTSGGFTAAYNDLRPEFERSSGRSVKTAYGASMGNADDSIPSRLARNEPADVVILARPALDALVAQGKVVPGSQVDLVRSSIGFAVRKGAPRPDISTVDALKRTLIAAPSIAYSASASGTYYETELLKKLGIEDQVKPKSKRILSERVGSVVARGDAALGLQQVSELLPIAGIDYIGPLPAEVQRVTVFSAGVATGSKQPDAARQLIRYLNSPAAAPTIAKTGLEPLPAR
ncbi:substrate-binding domain-containing protein [Variovorax sp. 160MFSha2.1]|uniref:substrate-binding domain-containing protein n=1 Tax=Variovorax sp. 160MFSha2.1 TaxID=3158367 RepID=UPI003AB01174